jgi:hypothetical protein
MLYDLRSLSLDVKSGPAMAVATPMPGLTTERLSRSIPMADSEPNTIVLTHETLPPGEINHLVRRLRIHVRNIRNAACRRTMGRDMAAAAAVIEQLQIAGGARD